MSTSVSTNYQAAEKAVATAFPNVFYIPLAVAAKFLGVSYKTVLNRPESMPAATIRRGKLRLVPAPELARAIAADMDAAGIVCAAPVAASVAATVEPEGQPELPKRRPGRPRKIAIGGV